ncbi:recombinase family protein [Bordetella genomosp. 11]|uniref:recombinase family protein n=1 Tax=Bordetella genomosp. 11 TaxID=1416808 RepID=UPI0020CCA402|nr:recombinase family protein [Bordetella genomosp. 11]
MLAAECPIFAKLMGKLEDGDTLVVTKLDRLGRNATDVVGTVERLLRTISASVCSPQASASAPLSTILLLGGNPFPPYLALPFIPMLADGRHGILQTQSPPDCAQRMPKPPAT